MMIRPFGKASNKRSPTVLALNVGKKNKRLKAPIFALP
jgi:hypothetical protein